MDFAFRRRAVLSGMLAYGRSRNLRLLPTRMAATRCLGLVPAPRTACVPCPPVPAPRGDVAPAAHNGDNNLTSVVALGRCGSPHLGVRNSRRQGRRRGQVKRNKDRITTLTRSLPRAIRSDVELKLTAARICLLVNYISGF